MRCTILTIAVLLLTRLTFSATIHVPVDQPTIQAGINAAANGDTVLVAPGVYNEQFLFQGKTIVVRSEKGPEVTTVIGSSLNDDRHPTVTIENGVGSDALLEGFTFLGGPMAIRVNGAAKIRRNILTDQTYPGWAALVVYGPALIINNTICYSTNGGIANYNNQALILNTIIAYNAGYGIYGNAILAYNDVFNNSPDYTNVNPGVGSIGANPQFVDEENRDFHLMYDSPCIDAGHPQDQYIDPDGTRNDIGALFVNQAVPVAFKIHYGLGYPDQYAPSLVPTVYWEYFDTLPTSQTAYELEIGTDIDWTTAEMWSTGIVESSDTSAVYDGLPLEDFTTYYLRIRVSNGTEWGTWTEWVLFTHEGHVIRIPDDFALIQDGMVKALAGDTVLVAPGIYRECITYGGREILVVSSKGADSTEIEGNISKEPTVSFVDFENCSSVLDGFTVTNYALGRGVYIKNGSPVIRNCIIRNCSVDGDGAGILCENSGADIINNRISENAVETGHTGGGMLLKGDNDDSLLIIGNEINGNSATNGSGITMWAANAYIANNVIYNNTGSGNYAGGIYVSQTSTSAIINNTIVENTNGIVFYPNSGANVQIRNNIVVENFNYGIWSGSAPCEYNDAWHNGWSNYAGNWGISADPLFTDPVNRDYSLSGQSPCIDAGNPNPAYNDPDGSRNDMGAFPYVMPNMPPELDLIDDMAVLEGELIDATISASDINETIPALTTHNMPEDANFIDNGDGTGNFSWDIPVADLGVFPILFVASDGELADSMTVTITVSSHPPEVTYLRIAGQSTFDHLVSHAPEIGWGYWDFADDDPYTKATVAVGTDDDWEFSEMWNPAPIVAPDTSVVYAGAPLIDGMTYYLRLRVHNGLVWSDWYHASFRMNSEPSVPVASSPGDNAVVNSSTVSLFVRNSNDAEGDPLMYTFMLYDYASNDTLIFDDFPEGPDSTAFTSENNPDNSRFWWKVRAFDGYEYSDWSVTRTFWVNGDEQMPTAFDLIYPIDTGGAQVCDIPAPFSWGASSDSDPRDSVHYTLQVSIDSTFTYVATYDYIYQAKYNVPALAYDHHYWWRVYAIDTKGNATVCNAVADFRTWVLGDVNQDGGADLGDVVFLINFVFRGGVFPDPFKVGDVNGDCTVDVADPVYLIAYLFKEAPPPQVGCAEYLPPSGD